MPTSWSDDAFGIMPERPDTPEFWKMVGIVNKHDGRMAEALGPNKDQVFEGAYKDQGIHPRDVTYMAFQRAIRALGITTRGEVSERAAEVARLSAMWMEAFLFGMEYAADHG